MIKVAHIKRIVCERYHISVSELDGPGVERELSQPRHMVMWLARRYTKKSYTNLGRIMFRHRNTIEVGVNKADKLIQNNPHWKRERDALVTEIENEARRLKASQEGTQETA